jgi:tRNA threonylcarbamoyladenosine biosynthesis protein TsaB
MKLLAIETATESCSAALLVDDEVICLNEIAPRKHNEIILSMCEQVLAQGETSLSQLDVMAFGRGPGAFTGVRLAASVTQGIALGQDLPVVPVSSLASLAQAAAETASVTQVLSCIDARMQEI